MAANKRKILEAARKLAQKGAKEKALREYERLVKLDPRDAKLRLEIGDAYRRWGQVDEANDTYEKVAAQYMRDGFDARAVAVFKQIVNLDPTRYSAYEPLAELYERMGLTGDALAVLQTAADGLHRDGRKREALELLRRMATLDPSNTTSRIKLAELLRQEGLVQEAVAEYEHVASELDLQGDAESSGKVLRRTLELDRDRVPTLVALVRNLLARRLAQEAEAPARRVLELESEEPDHYELLASVLRELGREDALAQVYRSLAELYRERGDEDSARAIQQRHVPPSDFSLPSEDIGGPLEGADLEEDGFLEGDELAQSEYLDDGLVGDDGESAVMLDEALPERAVLELDEPLEVPAAPRPAPRADAPKPAARVETDAPVEPEQLLAEASVYLRYGKRDKAIEHLERILLGDSGHRLALEKLGEALAEDGEERRAVETWLRAAECAREAGDVDAVAVLRDRIAALDEAAAAAIPQPGAPEHPEASAPPLDDIEIDLDIGELGSEPEGGDVGDAPAPDLASTAIAGLAADTDVAGASLSSTTSQQIAEDLEEADFYVQQGLLDEAEAIYQRILTLAPNHPRALVRLGELAVARGDDPSQAHAPVTAPEAVSDPSEASVPAAAPEAVFPPPADPMFEDEIDLPDPPRVDPTVQPASAEVEAEPARDGGVDLVSEIGGFDALDVAPIADDDGAAGFDLAAELSDALSDDPDAASFRSGAAGDDGFTAVFDAFKKGVEETLGEGDHAAHYDLGIAYKEMGLLDDAIGEFRVAMQTPERRVECLHLIGICALDAGAAAVAVEHLEELLDAPGASAEQLLAARFDLGRAQQELGDVEAARAAYAAVAALDASYREVGERLAELRHSPPDSEDSPGDPEILESFEDVLAEAPTQSEVESPTAAESPPPGPPVSPRRRRRKKISFV